MNESILKQLDQEIDTYLVKQSDIEAHKPKTVEALIQSPSAFREQLKRPPQMMGPTLPWPKTHDKIRLPSSEFTLWAGTDGHRKSMVLGQVAFDLTLKGEKCLIASFEMEPHETLLRIAQQAICTPSPSDEMKDKFLDYLDGKLYIYDKLDVVTVDEIEKMIEYAAEVLGVTQIFIDSLMMVDISEDDRPKQKRFAQKLSALCKKHKIHIHLVTHFTKLDPSKKISRENIAGTKALSSAAFNVFIIWMNEDRKEEAEKAQALQKPEIMKKPEMIIKVNKQRKRKFTGAILFDFDQRSLQMIEGRRIDYWEHFK